MALPLHRRASPGLWSFIAAQGVVLGAGLQGDAEPRQVGGGRDTDSADVTTPGKGATPHHHQALCTAACGLTRGHTDPPLGHAPRERAGPSPCPPGILLVQGLENHSVQSHSGLTGALPCWKPPQTRIHCPKRLSTPSKGAYSRFPWWCHGTRCGVAE